MSRLITTEEPNILTRLKLETAQSHQKTEDQLRLFEDAFSRTDYRNLLIDFYKFYQPFELQLKDAIQTLSISFDYSERLKTPKITNDLLNLGMTSEAIEKILLTVDLPPLGSGEKVFGALYVVEGSTLGGQLISRHLEKRFDLNPANGAAFFSGYGQRTGEMWNVFRSAIVKFAERILNPDEIIDSAILTFEKIGSTIRRK